MALVPPSESLSTLRSLWLTIPIGHWIPAFAGMTVSPAKLLRLRWIALGWGRNGLNQDLQDVKIYRIYAPILSILES